MVLSILAVSTQIACARGEPSPTPDVQATAVAAWREQNRAIVLAEDSTRVTVETPTPEAGSVNADTLRAIAVGVSVQNTPVASASRHDRVLHTLMHWLSRHGSSSTVQERNCTTTVTT